MIGELKDRITIEFVKKVSNGRGGWTHEYQSRGTVWGTVIEISARNIIQYRQVDMNVNTKIIVRANDNLNRHCVLWARGNKYIIEEIIEKDGYMSIMAVGERYN